MHFDIILHLILKLTQESLIFESFVIFLHCSDIAKNMQYNIHNKEKQHFY